MRLQRLFGLSFVTLLLIAGCGDGNNSTGSTTSNGPMPRLVIEKPEGAIDGQYIFFLDSKLVTPEQVESIATELLAPHGGAVLQLFDQDLIGFAANGLDDAKAAAIGEDERVASIGQDCVAQLQESQANAPWNLDRIDNKTATLDTKYDYVLDGEGVHVYVVDSGIRATHNEFGGRVTGGTSFINDGKGTDDCQGHGTHVAGIIGGSTYGVAKRVTLHPVRVADCDGKSAASTIMAAVQWIKKNVQYPAVVNYSLTTSWFSMLDWAVGDLSNIQKVPQVAAAGNDNADAANYSPVRDSRVLGVAASDKTDTRAADSNYGSVLRLFAPGVEITSAGIADDNATTVKSGTSMAAAHVTGVVALRLQFIEPSTVPSKIFAELISATPPNQVKDAKNTPNGFLYSRYVDLKFGFTNRTYFKDGMGANLLPDSSGITMKSSLWQSFQWQNAIPETPGTDLCLLTVVDQNQNLAAGSCLGSGQLFGFAASSLDVTDSWGTARFPDLNGDKRADFCIRGPQGIVCATHMGAGLINATLWDQDFTDAAGWSSKTSRWGTMRYVDVNGDGKDDVCARSDNGIVCRTSTGTSFNPISQWTSAFSDVLGWADFPHRWATIAFPDLNGDGKADVCGRGPNGFVCGLSDGTSFDKGNVSNITQWDDYFNDAGNWDDNPQFFEAIRFPDLNGDKKADICGRDVAGIVCRLSTGTTFGPASLWLANFGDATASPSDYSYWTTIQYADINGDGRADVCGRMPDGMHCALSTGSRFIANQVWDATTGTSSPWMTQPYHFQTVKVTDANGDGRADLCVRFPDGLNCAYAQK